MSPCTEAGGFHSRKYVIDSGRQPGQLRRQPQYLAVIHQHEVVGVLNDTVDQAAAAEEGAGAAGDLG